MIRATVGRSTTEVDTEWMLREKAVRDETKSFVRQFSTGATRDTDAGIRENAGKPKVSIVLEARHAIAGVAGVLTQGSEKYSRANWRKGLMHTEVCDSLSRHLLAYLAGEDADPETGLLHVDHVLANALFLAELTRTRPDLDDRPVLSEKDDGR